MISLLPETAINRFCFVFLCLFSPILLVMNSFNFCVSGEKKKNFFLFNETYFCLVQNSRLTILFYYVFVFSLNSVMSFTMILKRNMLLCLSLYHH